MGKRGRSQRQNLKRHEQHLQGSRKKKQMTSEEHPRCQRKIGQCSVRSQRYHTWGQVHDGKPHLHDGSGGASLYSRGGFQQNNHEERLRTCF